MRVNCKKVNLIYYYLFVVTHQKKCVSNEAAVEANNDSDEEDADHVMVNPSPPKAFVTTTPRKSSLLVATLPKIPEEPEEEDGKTNDEHVLAQVAPLRKVNRTRKQTKRLISSKEQKPKRQRAANKRLPNEAKQEAVQSSSSSSVQAWKPIQVSSVERGPSMPVDDDDDDDDEIDEPQVVDEIENPLKTKINVASFYSPNLIPVQRYVVFSLIHNLCIKECSAFAMTLHIWRNSVLEMCHYLLRLIFSNTFAFAFLSVLQNVQWYFLKIGTFIRF